MGSCESASWWVWNWWEQGLAMQHPRASPCPVFLSQQEHSTGQPVGPILGTSKVSLCPSRPFQAVPPAPHRHPGTTSLWHHQDLMAYGVPRHRGVPMASLGACDIMGSLWGPCGIGCSWTCGCLSAADVQRDQPGCPWGWACGHHVLTVANTGMGTGVGQSRSTKTAWTETATNQGLGRSCCPIRCWTG